MFELLSKCFAAEYSAESESILPWRVSQDLCKLKSAKNLSVKWSTFKGSYDQTVPLVIK